MRYATIITAFLILAVLSGCASADAVLIDPSRTFPPTEHVQLLFEEPDRPYEVIAIIEGNGSQYNNQAKVIKAMRKRARKIGAHAIIPISTDTEYVPTTTFANPVAGSPPITIMGGNKIIMKVAAIRFTNER